MIDPGLIQKFVRLISTQTGLYIREQDRPILARKIASRMKSLQLSDAHQYYQVLASVSTNSNSAHREWRQLIRLLTTIESYFFRDKGQFFLLRHHLLPELIQHRRDVARLAANATKPSLRIWSAGCSTGEEAYSLAILVSELIPDLDRWDILIVGTDINDKALEKARRGVYGPWSFRLVDEQLKRQHFHQNRYELEIDDRIKKIVTFQYGNLVCDDFPNSNSNLAQIDLILCRNVFIYFDPLSISKVLDKFYRTLREHGYLMTAHAELHGIGLGHLSAKMFPQSVVYQRHPNSEPQPANVPTSNGRAFPLRSLPPLPDQPPLTSPSPTPTPPRSSCYSPLPAKRSAPPTPKRRSPRPSGESNAELAEACFRDATVAFVNGAYLKAIDTAERATDLQPRYFDAYYLLARSHANLGDYNRAIYYCQQALQIDAIAVSPYYLLAHIAEEQGNIDKAKTLFKRIIYLEPSSIFAYLELGSIYDKEGDRNRAVKMRTTALELLQELPPDRTLDPDNRLTAADLIQQVRKMLKI
jgi:chemotaxis protein methyltransferase CheR